MNKLLTILKRFRSTALTLLVLGASSWWLLPRMVSLPPRLLQQLPASPVYLATDGKPLRQMLSSEGQRVAAFTPLNDIPQDLINATLAAEDKRFYSHSGLDLQAIARAAWDDLHHLRIVSGASTITQQLVKISSGNPADRSLWRKLVEALQARHLEMIWSKERILAEYLNRVSYGHPMTGCASAAQGFFNKPLQDLSTAECALLASLPQSPSRLHPLRHPESAQKRRAVVLQRMAANHWLDDKALAAALAEPLVLKPFNGGFQAPHAVAMLADAKAEQVATTIDRSLQLRVETIITQRLMALRDRHVTQAAAVVIENETGRVLALAGSSDFQNSTDGQINGAWAPHSAGSAVKPFTYLLALNHGYTPATIIADLPIEFSTPTGIYRPENYDHRNYGPVTLRMALGSSLNIPAVRALQDCGGEQALYTLLQDLGITSLTESPEHYGLGLTIGNAPVRLIELANAYACLARQGQWKPWTLLAGQTANGSRQVLPAAQCYLIADILSDNQARVATFGPNSAIRLPFRCAVKTGTSRHYRDNWAVGFTPEFTVGVWAGNFDHTPMENVSGVSGAGPIFRDIFQHLAQLRSQTWFAEPAGIVHARIDPRTGHRLAAQSPAISNSREELFISGTQPPESTAEDYEPGTARAYLPEDYTAWLAKGDHWLTGLVCLRPVAPRHEPPEILSPASGTVFHLDASLRDNGSRLLLKTRSLTPVQWSSPTLAISSSTARLSPGRHLITATDESTGLQSTVRIEVR